MAGRRGKTDWRGNQRISGWLTAMRDIIKARGAKEKAEVEASITLL